jgi:hypothetical protein
MEKITCPPWEMSLRSNGTHQERKIERFKENEAVAGGIDLRGVVAELNRKADTCETAGIEHGEEVARDDRGGVNASGE